MHKMDILEEEVAFSHDILSEKHRRTRNNNEQKWRKDRNLFNRYTLVDRKFTKRRLHKLNRKDPDVCSATYYKTGYSLGAVCYGLT